MLHLYFHWQANSSYSDQDDERSSSDMSEPFRPPNVNNALTSLSLVNACDNAPQNTDRPTTSSEVQTSAVYANIPACVDQQGSDYEDALEVIGDVDQRAGTPKTDTGHVTAPAIYENMRESESTIYMNLNAKALRCYISEHAKSVQSGFRQNLYNF